MKHHILIVDDEVSIRQLLSDFFKRRGYETTSVESGFQALAVLRSNSFNAVILDIALGDADGLEVLVSVKAAYPGLPVIMLTGMGYDDELSSEAMQKGAADFVSKTMPLDQIHGIVEKHLQAN